MNDPIEQRYYDLRQAAVYLGLSPKTLYAWIADGKEKLPVFKFGRVYRFDKALLDEWAHSRPLPATK